MWITIYTNFEIQIAKRSYHHKIFDIVTSGHSGTIKSFLVLFWELIYKSHPLPLFYITLLCLKSLAPFSKVAMTLANNFEQIKKMPDRRPLATTRSSPNFKPMPYSTPYLSTHLPKISDLLLISFSNFRVRKL